VSQRSLAISLLAVLLAAGVTLWLFERQLSAVWLRLGVHPEVLGVLERSLVDQKRLSGLDPAGEGEYRRRFEDTQQLLNRLRILEHNSGRIESRYRSLLVGLVGAVLLAAAGVHWLGRSRQQERLTRLRDALVALSAGRDAAVGDRRRDLLGRIAVMIDEISQNVADDRRRLAALANLSVWQEAARRQVHELRTPLAAAQLTLARLQELPLAEPARRAAESLAEDFDRLTRFTHDFTSFARLPEPRRAAVDLGEVVAEFVDTFADAWPSLTLTFAPPAAPVGVLADREMLRQVLVNLLDNSARALQGRAGHATLRLAAEGGRALLDVADDGPGLAPEIAGRVFEPYATTQKPGQGMGLGLAIAQKILLDHGGDLEVLASSAAGATFRLTLPLAAAAAATSASRAGVPA
jgi:two-component system nitrogen regulation sensor histidine kinase NtrY